MTYRGIEDSTELMVAVKKMEIILDLLKLKLMKYV